MAQASRRINLTGAIRINGVIRIPSLNGTPRLSSRDSQTGSAFGVSPSESILNTRIQSTAPFLDADRVPADQSESLAGLKDCLVRARKHGSDGRPRGDVRRRAAFERQSTRRHRWLSGPRGHLAAGAGASKFPHVVRRDHVRGQSARPRLDRARAPARLSPSVPAGISSALEWLAVRMLGFSELASGLSRCSAVWRAFRFFLSSARRILGHGTAATFLAVAIFAVSEPLIRYAGEAKPYETDFS